MGGRREGSQQAVQIDRDGFGEDRGERERESREERTEGFL